LTIFVVTRSYRRYLVLQSANAHFRFTVPTDEATFHWTSTLLLCRDSRSSGSSSRLSSFVSHKKFFSDVVLDIMFDLGHVKPADDDDDDDDDDVYRQAMSTARQVSQNSVLRRLLRLYASSSS